MSFFQFWNGKTCAVFLDTVIFVRQNRGQLCWMFSKFQFYHKEPHAQTQLAWLTRAGLWSHWKAQFPASADGPNHSLWGKTWWKATIIWRLQGVFTAASDKKTHCEELSFHASKSNSVLYQHCPAWVWLETARSSAPYGAGRGLPPSSPRTLPSPLDSSSLLGSDAAALSLPAFCPKKCRMKGFFPQQVLTGLAQTCPSEIWQKCPPASCNWETGSVSLTQLRHQPPELLLTPSIFAHIRGLTLQRLLCSPMYSPASTFQPPGLRPKGTDLALLSVTYFNRDRPGLVLILRAETRSGAGMKLTPARWAQPQEPTPSNKV